MKTRFFMLLLLALMAVMLFGQEDAKAEAIQEMKPRFEELKPFIVAGIEVENTLEPDAISGLFDKFLSMMDKIPQPLSKGIYGISYPGEKFDYKTMEGSNYFVGMTIAEDGKVPEEFKIHKSNGGKYAVFEYTGPIAGIGEAYGYIFGKWLMDSGMRPAGFETFEYYGEKFDPEDPKSTIEIWIPVM